MTSRPIADLSRRRRYLHHEVAERLRALILSGELPPRSRINEIALTERFGISRTPLREAIKILGTEGLLELLPSPGAQVASFSAKEIDDMLAVIAGLEAMGAELACERITDAEMGAVAVQHEAMVAAWEAGDGEAASMRIMGRTLTNCPSPACDPPVRCCWARPTCRN